MSASWWVGNLVAYSIQVALLVAVGELTAAVLRLKQPRVMLAYWQVLLAACLFLPLLEPWQRVDFSLAGGASMVGGMEAVGVDSLLKLLPLQTWVLSVCMAGVGVGVLRLALGIWRLNHYRRAALRITHLPGTLREALALVGVEPTFYFSDRVESPITFGWLRPAIVFPRCFEQLDESQQRAIACHELLHVARRDWLVNLFEELILVFFWFHPAVWWGMRNVRLAREQVVDSEVVALTGARETYLHALFNMAAAPRLMPAPLFLVESQLAQRVAALVKEVRMSKPRLIASLVVALAAVVATGCWAVKTFWLVAPLQPPTRGFGYGISDRPDSDGASTSRWVFFELEDDIKGPVPISVPAPAYTPQARKDRVKGAVVTTVDVDDHGNVAGVKLKAVSLSRNPAEGLDQSVTGTVRTWKFKPAMKKGKPVPIKVTVQVNFNLGFP